MSKKKAIGEWLNRIFYAEKAKLDGMKVSTNAGKGRGLKKEMKLQLNLNGVIYRLDVDETIETVMAKVLADEEMVSIKCTGGGFFSFDANDFWGVMKEGPSKEFLELDQSLIDIVNENEIVADELRRRWDEG